MNYKCPGNKSHVYNDPEIFQKHLKTCDQVGSVRQLFACKYNILHLFKTLPKKKKHEMLCPDFKEGVIEDLEAPVTIYFREEVHQKFKLRLRNMKSNLQK